MSGSNSQAFDGYMRSLLAASIPDYQPSPESASDSQEQGPKLQACSRCRRHKKKCDITRPCRNCMRKKKDGSDVQKCDECDNAPPPAIETRFQPVNRPISFQGKSVDLVDKSMPLHLAKTKRDILEKYLGAGVFLTQSWVSRMTENMPDDLLDAVVDGLQALHLCSGASPPTTSGLCARTHLKPRKFTVEVVDDEVCKHPYFVEKYDFNTGSVLGLQFNRHMARDIWGVDEDEVITRLSSEGMCVHTSDLEFLAEVIQVISAVEDESRPLYGVNTPGTMRSKHLRKLPSAMLYRLETSLSMSKGVVSSTARTIAVTPEEYDAHQRAAPQDCRPLFAALGDLRTGRQLLQDRARDASALSFEKLQQSVDGRRMLQELTEAVQRRFAPLHLEASRRHWEAAFSLVEAGAPAAHEDVSMQGEAGPDDAAYALALDDALESPPNPSHGPAEVLSCPTLGPAAGRLVPMVLTPGPINLNPSDGPGDGDGEGLGPGGGDEPMAQSADMGCGWMPSPQDHWQAELDGPGAGPSTAQEVTQAWDQLRWYTPSVSVSDVHAMDGAEPEATEMDYGAYEAGPGGPDQVGPGPGGPGCAAVDMCAGSKAPPYWYAEEAVYSAYGMEEQLERDWQHGPRWHAQAGCGSHGHVAASHHLAAAAAASHRGELAGPGPVTVDEHVAMLAEVGYSAVDLREVWHEALH